MSELQGEGAPLWSRWAGWAQLVVDRLSLIVVSQIQTHLVCMSSGAVVVLHSKKRAN